MPSTRPIIVTASLPPDLFAMANRLRQAHFPPDRNFLAAHLTLFHAIPPSCESELRRLLADIAGQEPPPPARLSGIMSLGRGTALAIESADLFGIRARIAGHFVGNLTAQDDHRPRLHVTVQNKVSSAEARALQARLADDILPRDFAFPALEMHFYDGGPWEFAGRWPFRKLARRR
ncbi:2'-5' RNA ligase family protein [Croceicoccus ponticola]|uniref:2'-5' RNA ligase family protein n=1 Tax=Croceicoccus ponticola TaxID=2217664 RepID=A0A437GZG4_9SPHN|nr:2'-5' RNA ligase family protein [Croceicoccus ponticola]RVQ68733.1 2'-5' RNA ligase family protein [Croceicoccus ponticola]